MMNRRPGECERCGTGVPVGAGTLRQCIGSSENHWDCGEYGRWHVACADRAACLARRAQKSQAAEELGRRRHAATVALDALRREFQAAERPAGQFNPDGEELDFSGSASVRLHGSGEWFVLGPAEAWYIQNHGGDGDDWSANNIRTGGAGALGWRLPSTPELLARIRAAHAARRGT